MISGFLTPGEPLFMDLNIPKYYKKYKTTMETVLAIIFINMQMFWFFEGICTVCFEILDTSFLSNPDELRSDRRGACSNGGRSSVLLVL